MTFQIRRSLVLELQRISNLEDATPSDRVNTRKRSVLLNFAYAARGFLLVFASSCCCCITTIYWIDTLVGSHLCPQDLLLRLLLQAFLKQVTGLSSVAAPQTLRGGPLFCPVQVQTRWEGPLLKLVKRGRMSLGAPGLHAVRPVAFWDPVLCLRGPTSSSQARFRRLLLGDLPLEVRKESREGHSPHFRPATVIVIQPFHPAGIRLHRRDLRPLVGLLIASDALLSRTPPDLDGNARPCLPVRIRWRPDMRDQRWRPELRRRPEMRRRPDMTESPSTGSPGQSSVLCPDGLPVYREILCPHNTEIQSSRFSIHIFQHFRSAVMCFLA